MEIEIIGTESLGVRGLCCFVTTPGKRILIDPGIALGYMRHKLLPHPFQVALDERIQEQIVSRWKQATDIVISHFHGDHVPIANANPYQLNIRQVLGVNPRVRIWTKPPAAFSPLEQERAADLSFMLGNEFFTDAGGDGEVRFSEPVPHGDAGGSETVMMTRIAAGRVFVHASDIQLLNEEAISRILEWAPDVVLAAGPPLYLARLSEGQIEKAWKNAVRLARSVSTLILDHHLMRDMEGPEWLKKLSMETGRKVLCGADFMQRPRMFLEADREKLYEDMPVSADWHETYGRTRAGGDVYWERARKLYKEYRLTKSGR
ncbi:MAG: MBL fold metallo-hydrolase [Desulfosalsimonadaceae bacterium]